MRPVHMADVMQLDSVYCQDVQQQTFDQKKKNSRKIKILML